MSNIIGEVQSAPETFTSWDKCMDKTYCKWPAIVGIIIGSLILLSVLFCLVQCLCCGVSCAKMLCCCCRGCGRGGKSRDKPARFKDDYQHMPPTPYSGYQPTPNPMMYRGAPSTATFDVSNNKKINEDSLPPMPSWETAQTRRIIEESPREKPMEDVEMGRLPPIQTQPQRSTRNGYNQVPNGPMSPTTPTYSQNSYFATHPQNQNSDLGAQRMARYDHYDDTPHSPAPTYHTNPQTDSFVAGAAAATPYQYQGHQAQSSYAPSSTRYQESDFTASHTQYQPQPFPYQSHRVSPPPMHGARSPSFGNYNHSPYGGGSISPPSADVGSGGGRPPSLLQIGRKAVPGSQREV